MMVYCTCRFRVFCDQSILNQYLVFTITCNDLSILDHCLVVSCGNLFTREGY